MTEIKYNLATISGVFNKLPRAFQNILKYLNMNKWAAILACSQIFYLVIDLLLSNTIHVL